MAIACIDDDGFRRECSNNCVQLSLDEISYLANKFSGFVILLNSKLFPDGSFKNIVFCSPGSPAKRVCGSMIKLIL